MIALPQCRHRGVHLGQDRYACHSPKLVVSKWGVTAGICNRCPYADHEPDSNQAQRIRTLPKPRRGLGDWAAAALDAIGVKGWTGCGCAARKHALNRFWFRWFGWLYRKD